MNLLTTLIFVPVDLRLILQDINLIAQIVGIIMIVFYVFYTYKTFRQIKKQTDYQQDAYLTVDVLIHYCPVKNSRMTTGSHRTN